MRQQQKITHFTCRLRRPNRMRGYTLLETIVGMSIFTIIVGGTTALLVMLLRLSNTLSAGTMASVDASLAISRVTQNIRQAQSFTLMDGGTFGTTYYSADPSNVNNVVVTGVRVVAPAPAPTITAAIGGSSGNVALSGVNALVDRKTAGATLDFYRSSPSGVPQPLNGTCLWMKGTENGVAVDRALVKSVAPQWNAVQFFEPYMPDGVTPLPNAITIKLTCSYYSRINGNASSDSGKGGVTQLTGECIYLRNHTRSASPQPAQKAKGSTKNHDKKIQPPPTWVFTRHDDRSNVHHGRCGRGGFVAC